MTRILICLLFFLKASFVIYSQSGEKYLWPLRIANGISSSFQEFRSSHFHAGIDLRTFMKTGYPVYAVADGQIFKIRVANRGTGKVLYLRHNDSNISIYYHLDRFSDHVEKIVQQVRLLKEKKYFGDHELNPVIPVKRGEIIAFSGETGAGFPHLHFELRDAEYRAINPFLFLVSPLKDNRPPVLRRIILRSIGDSTVDGDTGEFAFNFSKIGHHQYGIKNPIVIMGKADWVVNAFDIADTGKVIGPGRLRAWIDNQQFFDLVFGKFSQDENNQLGFVYDMGYSVLAFAFYNLFNQTGYNIEQKQIPIDTLWNNIGQGFHTLKIEVVDYFDNITTGLVPFYKLSKPNLSISQIIQDEDKVKIMIDNLQKSGADKIKVVLSDDKKNSLFSGDLAVDETIINRQLILKNIDEKVTFLDFVFIKEKIVFWQRSYLLDKNIAENFDINLVQYFINRDNMDMKLKSPFPFFLQMRQGNSQKTIEPVHNHNDIYHFVFSPEDNPEPVYYKYIYPNDRESTDETSLALITLLPGQKISFHDKEFRAEFAANTVKEKRLLKMDEVQFTSKFPILSRQINLFPHFFPFLDTVYYQFSLPEELPNPNQIAIFKYVERGHYWRCLYTEYIKETKTFQTRVISSGIFALMRDIFPPQIRFFRPSRQLKKVSSLRLKISDMGKGIDDESLKVWLNNRFVDCEYDPDWSDVKINPAGALKIGENTLLVSVKDYADYLTQRTFRFYLN